MSDIAELEWNWDDNNPSSVGWYAVAVCWDPEEGICMGTGYWTGVEWVKAYAPTRMVAFVGPFPAEATAEDWAYKHDLGG